MPLRLLALLTAAVSLALAPAALAAGPDLKSSVSASPNPVAAGQYVTLQIGVDNAGDAAATNAVVKSFMPPRTQFVGASEGCALVSGEVRCPLASLAPGGNRVYEVVIRLVDFSFNGVIQTFATAQAPGDTDRANDGSKDNIDVYNFSHDHGVTVSKNEKQISLPAKAGITEYTLACPNPQDVMVDGNVRVDNVDQGTGTLKSLTVLEQQAFGNGYRFKVANNATGQAQGKAFGTCISKTTQSANADFGGPLHTHDIQISEPKLSAPVDVVAGQVTAAEVSCEAGQPGQWPFVAVVAPGYAVNGAEGFLEYSRPSYDQDGKPAWSFGFRATQSGKVTFSIRCLNRWVSTAAPDQHTHELWLSRPDRSFAVGPNAPAGGTYDIDCSDEAKGIVAGWTLQDGLFPAGNDPQPKRRSFKFVNFSDASRTAAVSLLCVGDRTGTDPPAPTPPTAVAATARVARAGASVPVRVTCPAGGCGGTVELLARPSGTRATAAAARVLGRATFRGDEGRTTARVRILGRHRGAVASGRISRVTAVVRNPEGTVTARRAIRLRRP